MTRGGDRLNQAEYQRLRRQLDEELRAGIEMLQAGYRAKVDALDELWIESREEPPASPPAPPEPLRPEPPATEAPLPRERERREAGELREDVEAALAAVGDEFDKSDIRRALGYTPNRTSLHRALWDLQREGLVALLHPGRGRRATRYRKTDRKAGS
jgi:hypothetical protein